MRNVFLATTILLLCGGAGQAQVINGEGTFESNRGFDRAPEDPPTEKPPKPIGTEPRQDAHTAR